MPSSRPTAAQRPSAEQASPPTATGAGAGVAWTVRPDAALSDLRRAFLLESGERHRVIKDVAHRLHMPKMARFVEQMSV